MPSLDLSEEHVISVRSAINDLLGLHLSDEEIKTLLTGEALSFQQLVQSRSLSEMGMALIRSDALNRLPKSTEALESECPNGCILVKNPFNGEKICVCAFRIPPLELHLH